jgi:hypothetical protein
MLKNKLKSFTLSEMMVVLVITVIVVGLTFSVLNLIQKQMWIVERNFEEGTQANLLRQSLWIDFSRFPELNYNSELDILEAATPLESVSYKFDEKWIIKEQDTFFLQLKQKTFYFDGKLKTSGAIDAVELNFLQDKKENTIMVFQRNTASEYMR